MKKLLLCLPIIALAACAPSKPVQPIDMNQDKQVEESSSDAKQDSSIAEEVETEPAPVEMQKAMPVPPDQGAASSSSLQTYENTVYNYSTQFPAGWFVDDSHANDTFTPRGPEGPDQEMIGGDMFISNYKDFSDLPDDALMPSDFHALYFMIFQVDPKMTMDEFIEGHEGAFDSKEDVQLGNTKAVKLMSAASEEEPEVVDVLVKVNGQIFNLHYNGSLDDPSKPISKDARDIYDQIIASFTLTKG